jgi:guanylate kinase
MWALIGAIFVALALALFFKPKLFGKRGQGSRAKVDAVVLSGPSGVGKGTLIKRLMEDRPGVFAFCVSHTSRAPREGEVDGLNYHFSSKTTMQSMLDRGEFLECCEVHGSMYGTSRSALARVQETGKVPIIEIDVQGAQKLKKQQGSLSFFYMFINAPSIDELETRIRGRSQESEERIQTRLASARAEIGFMETNRAFFDKVLVNKDVDECLAVMNRLFKLYCGL